MRNKKSALAALAVLVVVALSGCVRFQAELTVSPNDTVNGTIVAAALVGDEADSREQAESIATQIEEQLLPGLRGAPGVTATVYDEDDHLGTRFSFTDTPLYAFSSESFSLTRDGEEFVFSGALDFTPEQDDVAPESDADTSNITVSITFPGAVEESNGKVSGNTVSWSTTYEQSIVMDARGSAVSSGPPVWLIVVGGVGAVLALAVVIAVAIKRWPRGTE